MKNVSTGILASLIALIAFSCSIDAKVSLPHIFGSDMVLQRQTNVKIWGTAEPSSQVTLRASWDEAACLSTFSDPEGKWALTVSTPEAGGPYSIVISDGEALELEDVLVGEVWVCSGQSNMEMPVKGNAGQPVEGSADVIMNADPETPIRMCTVIKSADFTPQGDCNATWTKNTPNSVANTSATAYFFARYIQSVLKVPVGIIVTCWGGSRIEAWMDRETVSSGFPEFDLSYIDKEEYPEKVYWSPVLLYNGMLSPVIPYTVKGMIWFQGEANVNNPDRYLRLQPEFVRMIRDKWGLGDFPFYYAQISLYRGGNPDNDNYARLRESQMKALELIPNSGMAVTFDLGDPYCVHFARKQEVGQRLALLALTKTYGMTGIDPDPPVYKSWRIQDNKAFVTFNVGNRGLAPQGHILGGFEVAGQDREFHPATGKIISNDEVEVSCPEVADPVSVRYCFHNCAEASLFNCFGIPASPFRTDDW